MVGAVGIEPTEETGPKSGSVGILAPSGGQDVKTLSATAGLPRVSLA